MHIALSFCFHTAWLLMQNLKFSFFLYRNALFLYRVYLDMIVPLLYHFQDAFHMVGVALQLTQNTAVPLVLHPAGAITAEVPPITKAI